MFPLLNSLVDCLKDFQTKHQEREALDQENREGTDCFCADYKVKLYGAKERRLQQCLQQVRAQKKASEEIIAQEVLHFGFRLPFPGVRVLFLTGTSSPSVRNVLLARDPCL